MLYVAIVSFIKIDGKSSAEANNSFPIFIFSIVIVTFSYALAGLIVDFLFNLFFMFYIF
jgi:uncharacterized membrane protein